MHGSDCKERRLISHNHRRGEHCELVVTSRAMVLVMRPAAVTRGVARVHGNAGGGERRGKLVVERVRLCGFLDGGYGEDMGGTHDRCRSSAPSICRR